MIETTMEIGLLLTDQPPDTLRDLLLKGISAANVPRLGASGSRLLSILIQRDGETIGGLLGRTFYRRLTVELLFVPEGLRGQGLGEKILRQAEDEAKKRDCIGAWLETFSPDAHRFYLRQGYKTFGEIADYPPGNTRYFMAKDFGQAINS
jgi:GNAT superfamily N-acetyltransferase